MIISGTVFAFAKKLLHTVINGYGSAHANPSFVSLITRLQHFVAWPLSLFPLVFLHTINGVASTVGHNRYTAWVQVSEEVRIEPEVMVERLGLWQKFHQAQLQHGDILVVQHDMTQVPLLAYFVLHYSLPVPIVFP